MLEGERGIDQMIQMNAFDGEIYKLPKQLSSCLWSIEPWKWKGIQDPFHALFEPLNHLTNQLRYLLGASGIEVSLQS